MVKMTKIDINEMIEHLKHCIENYTSSKIDPNTKDGKDILEMEGFSGTYTRHFYNNLLSFNSDIRYLEIGVWKGSSSACAMYKNNITGVFIDNWSQFNGNVSYLLDVFKKFGNQESKYYIIECDSWQVDINALSTIGPFNMYLYDGGHEISDHYKSLEYYYQVLDDEFVLVVDDWNWFHVREGTCSAMRDLGLVILYKHEEFMNSDELINMPNHLGKFKWWNGIGIFYLKKKI